MHGHLCLQCRSVTVVQSLICLILIPLLPFISHLQFLFFSFSFSFCSIYSHRIRNQKVVLIRKKKKPKSGFSKGNETTCIYQFVHTRTLIGDLRLLEFQVLVSFDMINFANLFYYLAYFCYYLWVSLHFLVLFIDSIVLFQLTFTFIYSTFSKKFQFQQNMRIPNKLLVMTYSYSRTAKL